MKKQNQFNAAATFAALAAGGAFTFTLEGAAKKIPFVANNFLAIKTGAPSVIGAGLVYFGKDETTRAAGYSLLGVAGSAGASMLTTMAANSTPAQGAGDRMKRIQDYLAKKRTGNAGTQQQLPASAASNNCNWSALAMADTIYRT